MTRERTFARKALMPAKHMGVLEEGAREFGLELTAYQLQQFEAYYRLLTEWNRRFNLTAITGYAQFQVKHLLDSLSVARALPVDRLQGRRLVDIGAGAGFPGLPLAVAFPELQVTLLEATQKKVAFLETVRRELELENVETVSGRAEELGHRPGYRENNDYAVARAVAELRTLVEYALPLVKVGGRFIAQKSANIEDELSSASKAIEALGGRLKERIPVRLPSLEVRRQLVVIDKIEPTPAAYPRRVGVPSKRPL